MKILRADHLGMCFGVRDAIALALKESDEQPLTIFGELVHNERVLQQLKTHGVRIATEANALSTKAVMITAHGASDSTLNHLRDRGHEVIQATCPLVHFAHRSVAKLVREGYYPIIIGKPNHVEVRGMTGDLSEFGVVDREADIDQIPMQSRYGIVAQTTQPIAKVRALVASIRTRFPNAEVRFTDTVCQPTKQRQAAAVELARKSDVVVVIGGSNSNNTHELVQTCAQHCRRVFHVQRATDLKEGWFAGAETVGITAGTSTPDITINEVEEWLLVRFEMAVTA